MTRHARRFMTTLSFVHIALASIITLLSSPLLAADPLAITFPLPGSLPAITENAAIDPVDCAAEGGVGALTWYLQTGHHLPQGLSLNGQTGVISGTPTDVAGDDTHTFTIWVKDEIGVGAGHKDYVALSWRVLEDGVSRDPLVQTKPESFEAAMEGQAVAPILYQAAGGDYPYGWTITGLPDGLTFSTVSGGGSGYIEGTPIIGSGNAVYDVTFAVTDDINAVVTRTLTMRVCKPVELISEPDLGNIPLDEPFECELETRYGYVEDIGHCTFSVTGGDLPGWLELDESTGVLSGTPAAEDIHVFTIEVRDQWSPPTTSSVEFTLEVGSSTSAPVEIFTEHVPAATVGSPYTVTLAATGGLGEHLWEIGNLPEGLAVTEGRIISGIPTVESEGVYAVSVTVTDSEYPTNNDRTILTLVVNPASEGEALSIATTYLPRATETEDYGTVPLEARGGDGVYTWEAKGLPGGLRLEESFILGAPLAQTAGSYYVEVVVTDGEGAQSSAIFTLTVTSDIAEEGEDAADDIPGPVPLLTAAAPAGACSLGATHSFGWLVIALVMILFACRATVVRASKHLS